MVAVIVEEDVNCRDGWGLGFQFFQHLLVCLGIDLLGFDKGELKGLKIKRTLDVEPFASRRAFQGDLLCLEEPTMGRLTLVFWMHRV